jgi:hypothetical protein
MWRFSEEVNLKRIGGRLGGGLTGVFGDESNHLFAVKIGARIGSVEI